MTRKQAEYRDVYGFNHKTACYERLFRFRGSMKAAIQRAEEETKEFPFNHYSDFYTIKRNY